MNILIISDIHGSHRQLNSVLETPYPFDMVILVGDLMYHGPRNPILEDYNPAEVAKILNNIQKPIVAVRGNCDSEVDQMLLDFPMLQDYSIVDANGKILYISHGHLMDPLTEGPKTGADAFITGHTHVPIEVKIDNTTIYNPGSIALPKENHPCTYGYYSNGKLTTYTLEHKVYRTTSL